MECHDYPEPALAVSDAQKPLLWQPGAAIQPRGQPTPLTQRLRRASEQSAASSNNPSQRRRACAEPTASGLRATTSRCRSTARAWRYAGERRQAAASTTDMPRVAPTSADGLACKMHRERKSSDLMKAWLYMSCRPMKGADQALTGDRHCGTERVCDVHLWDYWFFVTARADASHLGRPASLPPDASGPPLQACGRVSA